MDYPHSQEQRESSTWHTAYNALSTGRGHSSSLRLLNIPAYLCCSNFGSDTRCAYRASPGKLRELHVYSRILVRTRGRQKNMKALYNLYTAAAAAPGDGYVSGRSLFCVKSQQVAGHVPNEHRTRRPPASPAPIIFLLGGCGLRASSRRTHKKNKTKTS